MARDDPFNTLKVEPLSSCVSYLKGKMNKKSFSIKRYKVKEVLELVYCDVYGLMSPLVRGGYEYFITFTDDCSEYLILGICTEDNCIYFSLSSFEVLDSHVTVK